MPRLSWSDFCEEIKFLNRIYSDPMADPGWEYWRRFYYQGYDPDEAIEEDLERMKATEGMT